MRRRKSVSDPLPSLCSRSHNLQDSSSLKTTALRNGGVVRGSKKNVGESPLPSIYKNFRLEKVYKNHITVASMLPLNVVLILKAVLEKKERCL